MFAVLCDYLDDLWVVKQIYELSLLYTVIICIDRCDRVEGPPPPRGGGGRGLVVREDRALLCLFIPHITIYENIAYNKDVDDLELCHGTGTKT